jgi:hypothetical protein
VLYLQSTRKALTRLGLGRDTLPGAGATDSALGNWFVNVVPLGGREAYLFMSTQSLLSFPIMIGQHEPGPEDMQEFLQHGVSQLMKSLKIPRVQSTQLLQDLSEMVLCINTDRALVGVHSAIANEYFQRFAEHDHLPRTDIGSVIMEANTTPRATLKWRHSFEVTVQLLAASVA